MSRKSFLKGFGRKVSLKDTPKEPRTLDEINKEYAQVNATAGVSQYKIYVYTEELKQLNQKLLELNREGDLRNKMDQEAAAKKAVETTKSESQPAQQGASNA